ADIDGRFQVVVDGHPVTDAPYAALAPREANGTIRFLDREGWQWELGEIATPPPAPPVELHGQPVPSGGHPVEAIDQPAWVWDHFFYPQSRGPTLIAVGGSAMYGIALGGGDRLGLQRWGIAGW